MGTERPSLAERMARSQNRSDTDPTWRTDYTVAAPDTYPCLSCRRPLTMRAHLADPIIGDAGRELFVCLGHPPRVHRDILAAVIAAESDGHVLSDRFGTFRCPGCGTTSTLEGLHVPGSDVCLELGDERAAKAGE